jgi:hypothetical protein
MEAGLSERRATLPNLPGPQLKDCGGDRDLLSSFILSFPHYLSGNPGVDAGLSEALPIFQN